MIDVHCHLEYMQDIDQVIAEARKKMDAIITSVADMKDMKKVLSLHAIHPDFVFVSLGLHPDRISKYSDAEIDNYIDFIKSNEEKIVAIGECGLDYPHVAIDERKRAEDAFIKFIGLAKELRLPIVIHARNEPGNSDCFRDVLRVLTNHNAKKVVMHCFSGSETNLKDALEQDYWISFATLICKSDKHKRLADKTPLERMLLETDAPWLHPSSKEMINRPWMITESAAVIAKIKGITERGVLQKTSENAKKVFGLLS